MKLLATTLVSALLIVPAAAQAPQAHNVIIFVADGLRYGSVEPGNMPNMARLKREGVDFTNSHSLYPTVTTVNASAIATGHGIGDTGDFGNTLYVGTPMVSVKGWQTAIVGKEGPARIQDSTADGDGNQTLILDDSTGHEGGLGLPNWFT